VLTCLGLLVVSCQEAPAPRPLPLSGHGTVIYGGIIHTMDPAQPQVEALVLEGRTIVMAGPRAAAVRHEEGAEMVDLRGAVVTPGLIDAHLHLEGIGWRDLRLDLQGTRTLAEVQETLRRHVDARPGSGWIRGRGWDQTDWPRPAWPTAADLDLVVSERPVALKRVDGHVLWVNTTALREAGIDRRTRDPAGGRIHRDAAGQPTGILLDQAKDLVERLIPPPTREERERALIAGARSCVRAGLTMVHDMGVDQEMLEIYRELAAGDRLPIRIYVLVEGEGESLEEILAHGPLTGERLTVRGVKLYADGALGSRGAALLEDYTDDPGNRGIMVATPERIEAIAVRCLEAGLQVATHAIGDRANRLVLDAYQRALAAVPGARDPRLRIEHAQVVAPADLDRFARLGVIASMQPTHATSDAPWVETRLGPDRLSGAYPWRSLLDTHALLAFGSDAPVESERPVLGLLAAVTRQDLQGHPPGGFLPGERISASEALAAFTRGAAYASFDEYRLGVLRAGFAADLVIWPEDPLTAPPDRLATIRPVRVWSAGRTVFATDAPDAAP
jgi:predicted amidohydrolase YtcJ